MKRFIKSTTALSVWLLCGLSGTVWGLGNGDYSVYLNGGDSVAYIGEVNTLEIWIANDAVLSSMNPAIEITFATAFSWDMGYGNFPPVKEEGRAIGCWNLTSLVVNQDFDNASPEHLMIGGVAMPGYGLAASSSELCYTLQFYIPEGEAAAVNGISIVPYVWQPAGYWTFNDAGGTYPPDFNGQAVASETNPVANPVYFDIKPRHLCGDVNCDGNVNVGDAVYLVNYVFKEGSPVPCAGCP